jgi:hypothetical protein
MNLLPLVFLLSLLPAGPAPAGQDHPFHSDVQNVWVQVVPPDRGQVRAITTGSRCPLVRFDGHVVRMKVRARPNPDFDVLVCERMVPRHTRHIRVAGRDLKPVVRAPKRIAVIGDTGCRMKAGSALDDGFQNCNDPDDWEFSKVAQRVADWQPDVIIQLGDYIYREQECPDMCGNCQNSPWNSPGQRMDTWNVEFFEPGRPMLEAAPLVLVRGDHEKCERAGGGYFRFLDPFGLRACADFEDPYLLDFQGLRLVVMDTVQADDTEPLSPQVVIDRYADDFELAARIAPPGTWLMSHRPIWALRPKADGSTDTDECDNQTIPDQLALDKINMTVQEALTESRLHGRLPRSVDLVLTAHIHVGEVLSFTGRRPPQMVVGKEIDGETVTHATMLSVHGFFGFTPVGQRAWAVEVVDVEGEPVAECGLDDKVAICEEP